MSAADFAKYHDLEPATVRRYKFEGRLPDPDAVIGLDDKARQHHGWLRATVEGWERPGQGARTDLKAAESNP